ncbi:hypothetical protein OS493_020166 [Desmophyllum pertusum]|uniref:Uncharacterized protein n=1 Tax=Desmophyllum pertusum TaxID=174260 RepID=A0A9X0DAP3_9CNID|nr:hypothetical protein OS493_020166 [Desmophyllum pertusum]
MPGRIVPAHSNSGPMMNSRLDLFHVPPTDVSMSSYRMVPIQTYTTAYLETLLNYNREDGKTVLAPQGWFNQIDVKEEYTGNNTNLQAEDGAGHAEYQALSQNHKDALAAQVAELTHYAGGKRRMLTFKPLLEAFQLSKVLVPGVQINIQFYMNQPSIFTDGVGQAARMVTEDIKVRLYLCQL